jgi:hypothetical protein
MCNTDEWSNCWKRCFLCGPCRCYITKMSCGYGGKHPCGGGFEYRSPASHRRRRKWKSQIWDNKIWSRVPSDSDPRKTTLVRSKQHIIWQTRPFVREGDPQKQDRNCQKVMKIRTWAADGVRHQDLLIDWLTVIRNVTLCLTFVTGECWGDRIVDEWCEIATSMSWREPGSMLGTAIKQRLVTSEKIICVLCYNDLWSV